jgi:hypothetical protein
MHGARHQHRVRRHQRRWQRSLVSPHAGVCSGEGEGEQATWRIREAGEGAQQQRESAGAAQARAAGQRRRRACRLRGVGPPWLTPLGASASRSAGGEPQSLATLQAARGRARPPYRHFKSQGWRKRGGPHTHTCAGKSSVECRTTASTVTAVGSSHSRSVSSAASTSAACVHRCAVSRKGWARFCVLLTGSARPRGRLVDAPELFGVCIDWLLAPLLSRVWVSATEAHGAPGGKHP